MGQIAEDSTNGLTCQYCGVWMPDVLDALDKAKKPKWLDIFKNPPGYPRTCPDCEEEHGKSEWE